MRKSFFFGAMLCLACTVSIQVNAQIKVASTGKVGIKISGTADPLANLSIGGAGIANTALYTTFSANPNSSGYGIYSTLSGGMSDAWKYSIAGISKANRGLIVGVKGDASSITTTSLQIARMYGIYGIAGGATNGKNYGVYGILQTGSSNGAGVFGSNNDTIQTLSARYAGYFRGQTYVNGDFYCTALHQTSDARLKTNITGIKQDALQKINDLRPIQFQWQQVDDVVVEDTTPIKTPHFSEDIDFEQKHYGFLAQEVQKLYPELVQEDGNGYMSVNYMELIPLLVNAVQELSAEVEELKKLNK